MRALKVNLKERSYQIVIGNRIIVSLGRYLKRLNPGNTAFVITNRLIKDNYGLGLAGILRKAGFLVKFSMVADTEKSKSISVASSVIQDLARFDQQKRIFIVALGGGVVGDLAGFVASVYKRGIPYIQVPTTLLAQVDSAIGGKTAVDLTQGKNLVGAFYQPKLVFSEIGFLKTLKTRQLKAGLAEVIKYGLIKDHYLFGYLEKNYRSILARKAENLEFMVWRSSRIKAGIIEKDEKEEKGLRTVLNFGHTIGHALEAASGYRRLNHGETVALGMLVACSMSVSLGLLEEKTSQRIEALLGNIGLPVSIRGLSLEKIITAHYRDKKFSGRKNKFVLLEDIGKTRIVQDLPLPIIKAAIVKRMYLRRVCA